MKRFLRRSYRSMTNLEERKEEEKKKAKLNLGEGAMGLVVQGQAGLVA
jgi:hypothetical protein